MDEDAEATHSHVRAAPGRVFLRLVRRAVDGTLVRGMHTELTPAEALRVARHLDECARTAIATDTPTADRSMARLLAPPA